MTPLRRRTVRPPIRLRLEPLDERAMPSGFRQTNLVADEPGVAVIHDPNLVNAWGMAPNPNGAIWVSAHGTGTSTLYQGDVNGSPVVRNPLVVTIPDGAPTGQVFNAPPGFAVTNGTRTAPAFFIFAGETGSITGWNPTVPPPTSAHVAVDTDGAARYTGLAHGTVAAGERLYAADLANGEIDVFDSAFQPLDLGDDAFVDPRLPRHFAPFNVQNLGGTLYVTYARADKGPDIDDLKGGVVSAFDLDGNFLRRVATQGQLNAPWGVALAPAGFGPFGGALLVGNHGDGRINAYDPDTGRFLGKLREDGRGRPVRIDGLFGLQFGNGRSFGDANALYFTAGPNDGADGLLGSLRFVADPPAGGRGFRPAAPAADGLRPLGGPTTPAPVAPAAVSAAIDWTMIYRELATLPPLPTGDSVGLPTGTPATPVPVVEELHV